MWLLLLACQTPEPPPLQVYAASSLSAVLPEVAEQAGVGEVEFSFDASSRLAAQVSAGAPVDLLFTADEASMDGVSYWMEPQSRFSLLSNALVLVVPVSAAWTPANVEDLRNPALQRLGLAGENVPAGKYAQAALEHFDVWTRVEPQVVRADNVRTALAWAARGEVDAAMVYATDARVEPGVKVAISFPTDSHPPIRYPVARSKAAADPERVDKLLDYLKSAEARAVFERAGFTVLP